MINVFNTTNNFNLLIIITIITIIITIDNTEYLIKVRSVYYNSRSTPINCLLYLPIIKIPIIINNRTRTREVSFCCLLLICKFSRSRLMPALFPLRSSSVAAISSTRPPSQMQTSFSLLRQRSGRAIT